MVFRERQTEVGSLLLNAERTNPHMPLPNSTEILGPCDDETITIATLARPYHLPAELAEGGLHSVTIFIADPDVTPPEQSGLCDELVALRPYWAICGGHDCERWHDMLDESLVSLFAPSYDVPDDRLILTTWHTGASVQEVMDFTLLSMVGMEEGPCRRAILIIGDGDTEMRREVDAALRLLRPQLFSNS